MPGSQSEGENAPTILSSLKSPSAPDLPTLATRELAGEMLAHFRLDDYVGVGGMGAVFRATDMRLDRSVALKILPPDQAKVDEIAQRFQNEARAAARLDHENIARVYYVGEDRGLKFIAFEFVEGINVRDLIQQCGALPPHEVVNYAIQITGALVHAYSRGVVHRDIKPSNIIITGEGRAKLVDMGLARSFERRQEVVLTQDGILGTFDYIAPEQARDPRSADFRSDIYSFGCTLYHMLTGQPPYPDGNVLQKLLKHHEGDPPDLCTLNVQVPLNVATLVRRMMARDPAKRYQTPQELLTDLLEIAAGMGLRSTSPEGLIWVSGQSRLSTGTLVWSVWLLAAAALILCVIGLNWHADSNQASLPTTPGSAALGTGPPGQESDSPELGAAATLLVDLRDDEGTGSVSPPVESPGPPEIPVPDSAKAQLSKAEPEPEVIQVGRNQDLRATIERSPSGSVIEISGEHRPQMMHKVDDTAGIRISGKRLTVRAAPGARPRIVQKVDAQAFGVGDWNLFTLSDAQVEFEGIHFEVQVDQALAPPMSMLSLASSELTLRRCSFLWTFDAGVVEPTRREQEPRLWVVQSASGIGDDGKVLTSKVTARECFFGGGEGGFALNGPARLELSDCLLLPFQSPFVIRSEGFAPSLAADIRLNNVSLFGSGSPIFDLISARASVTSQGVVYSHEAPSQGVLTRLDPESRLDWKGNHNLFHGIRHYLLSRVGAESVALARRLSDWLEMSSEVDERDSSETTDSPWILSLSEASAKNADDRQIGDAFRLVRVGEDTSVPSAGARFVLPWGPLYGQEAAESAALRMKRPAQVGVATATNEGSRQSASTDSRSDRPNRSESGNGMPRVTETGMPNGSKLDLKKIMSNMPVGEPGSTPSESATRTGGEAGTNSPGALVVDPQSSQAFPTIAAAAARAEDGAVIEIRHRGILREGPIELGDRHLTIRAAAGFRPIIELVANHLELRGREPRLFDIRRGSLTLKDLHFLLFVDSTVSVETWSVVASRTADIHMEGCTVFVQPASGASSSVARFLASEVDDPMAAPTAETPPMRPQFTMRNCLVAGADNTIRIQPAIRVRVELENCAVEVADSLSAVAGGMDRSIFGISNELEFRHCTVKMHHGMIGYEATEARAWLPRLEITASDTVFVGDPVVPWIHFRSPRSLDELRGLLRWKGTNNSYDGVATFWEIECMTTGETELLTWDEWVRSPARDEAKADRERVDFLTVAPDKKAWQQTREHFRPVASALNNTASGEYRGADLNLIPAPPHEVEPGSH